MVAALAIATVPAGPVGAHEGGEGLSNVVDSVDPVLPGLTVTVVASVADEVVVENRGADAVTVPDPAGRPFLRIGPEGVAADINAPFWYASNNPGAAPVLPPGVTTASEARWAKVAADPSWGWFDPRLPGRDVPAPGRPAPGTSVRLASWAIPLDVGGRPVQVRGHQEYAPATGSVRARVTVPPPPSTGLSLGLAPGGRAPAVFASWSGPMPVTILGEAGEPFIRLGPSGADANLDSPTWRAAQQAQGRTPPEVLTGGGSGDATVRWQHLDDAPRASWIDPRLMYGPGVPPPDVQARLEPTDLLRWSLPVETGPTRMLVEGVTEWVPDRAVSAFPTAVRGDAPGGRSSGRVPFWTVLGIATVVAALGLGVRRRARRPRRMS